jgi:hypothetical protein
MKQNALLLALALTIALVAAFLIPDNLGTRTVYDPVGGKAWSMRPPEAAAPGLATPVVDVSTAPPAAPPAALPIQTSQPAKAAAKRSRRATWTKRALAAQVVPLPQTHPELRPAVSSSTVPSAAVSTPTANVATPEYALEDIADRFEGDESKFPLDRSVDAGGLALHLIGLEKLPAMFVLKIAVVNSADADFFVKGFAVEAGNQDLSSRSIFRILVEPRRTREGYVLFERPPAGSDVHIKLKEDGGKGRALDMAIPYPF